MENKQLYHFFLPFWSAETSYAPKEWSVKNPSLGQCATTVLVIQDYLGGKIVKGKVHLKDGTIETHFWNCIDDKNIEIDATCFQYADNIDTVIPKPVSPTREEILAYPDTKRRYNLLKDIVNNNDTEKFFASLRLSL
jgi:hypothetical protein